MNRRAFIALSALAPMAPRDLVPPPRDELYIPIWGMDEGTRDRITWSVYAPPRLEPLGVFERAEGETDGQFMDRIMLDLRL